MRSVFGEGHDHQAAEDLFVLSLLFGYAERIYTKTVKNEKAGISHAIYSVRFSNSVMAHLEYSQVADGLAGFEMEWSSRDLVLDYSTPPTQLNRGYGTYTTGMIMASAVKADEFAANRLNSLLKLVREAEKGGEPA